MQDIALDVLERASLGNMDAFEEIYRKTSAFVYNIALRITRNNADAEEVTQDVFMKIYNNLKNFEFRSTFKTWVYRITVNTSINRYRKLAKEIKQRVDGDGLIESLPGGSSTAEVAIQNDNEAALNTLLGELNPEHRACLVLREIEDLSYKEISVALKIPVNTVRSRLNRARQALLEAGKKGES